MFIMKIRVITILKRSPKSGSVSFRKFFVKNMIYRAIQSIRLARPISIVKHQLNLSENDGTREYAIIV